MILRSVQLSCLHDASFNCSHACKNTHLRVNCHPDAHHTYKFLSAGEIEELDQAKVVPRHHVQPRMGDAGTVHVRLVCVPWPHAQHLVPKDTTGQQWGLHWLHNAQSPAKMCDRIGSRDVLYTLPGPGSPGDSVYNELLQHHLTTGNLMHLPFIISGRNLGERRRLQLHLSVTPSYTVQSINSKQIWLSSTLNLKWNHEQSRSYN